MTFEEFTARGREIRTLSPNLHRMLAQLYVDGGVLQQIVKVILEHQDDIKTTLANTQMVDENAVRVCTGLQGQVLGISGILQLIHELLTQPEGENNVVE